MAEAKHKGSLGGLVSHNSGTIKDCYSLTKIKGKHALKGGFVAENSGTIEGCCCQTKVKGLTGGFVGNDKGNTENQCYFFHDEKEGSKSVSQLSDGLHSQRASQIQGAASMSALGLSQDTYEYRGGSTLVAFADDQWTHPYVSANADTRTIQSAEDLSQWRDQVNSGDTAAQKAHLVLECDIDLGGKEWVPIGESRINAFSGVFDGKGHTVTNLIMTDKTRENKGFFAFNKGEIYNLSVDAKIQHGICVGALAAHNERGIIGCCSANANITIKAGVAGGLVGRNTGEIFKSYGAGTCSSSAIVLPTLPVLIALLLAVLVALLALYLVVDNANNIQTYAAVPYDEDQVPIPGEVISPYADGNYVSFQFQQEIIVSLATGLCNFEFQNPGESNHNIVVQLQISDAQAVRMMGSTGRSEEDQAALESNPAYDPDTSRVVIAESGAIRPGYQLSDLRLVELADGATLPKGSYNAMIYLVYYDIDSNSRAMIETQLPVEIYIS